MSSGFQHRLCLSMAADFVPDNVRIQSGDRGFGPTLPGKSQKYRVLCNTGPDPLTNHKGSKPAFNVGPLSARQRDAIQMAFRWRADDGPLIGVFAWIVSPL